MWYCDGCVLLHCGCARYLRTYSRCEYFWLSLKKALIVFCREGPGFAGILYVYSTVPYSSTLFWDRGNQQVVCSLGSVDFFYSFFSVPLVPESHDAGILK